MMLNRPGSLLIIAACACLGACAQHVVTADHPAPAPAGAPSAAASAPPQQSAALLPPETPAGDPRNYIGDPQLYALLNHSAMDSTSLAALADYEDRVGTVFGDMLGDVAEDSAASAAARINALTILAESENGRQYAPVQTALHARDPRVRAIALRTANSMKSSEALTLYKEALNDPAPEIQIKALQFIGSDDIDLLRSIVNTPGRSKVVTDVIRGLVQNAEEWGAPLQGDSATGTLDRTTASGYTVHYVPTARWTEWDASAGHVTVRSPQGKEIVIPGEIEVAGNVVPVFFSADSKYMVYESDRHIHVRDLSNGADRDVGPGVAPRVRPVTDQFVFLVEDQAARADLQDRIKVRYDVYSASFSASTPPTKLGAAGGFIGQGAHGAYSPARWMRIAEENGAFYLVAAGLEKFQLPSPFGTGS